MKIIGLDIGTTNICGLLSDTESGEVLKILSEPNRTVSEGPDGVGRCQDPVAIEESVRRILEALLCGQGKVDAIGISAAMHGILYLDREGNPVSMLYTWQDGRGGRRDPSGKTFAEALSEKTGHRLSTGFGTVTYAVHAACGEVPANAVCLSTVGDFIAMRLAGKKRPVMHRSMAASLGCYALETGCMDEAALIKAGINPDFYPEICTEEAPIGLFRGSIPVSPALGDNQAGYLGTVEEPGAILVNVGTGSQISVSSPELRSYETLECRPYIGGGYLYVGASLCGGFAYEILRDFFRETLSFAGADISDDGLYAAMNHAAEAAFENAETPRLSVDVRFMGSRGNPDLKGGISGLTAKNFTPAQLALGVIQGICDELYGFFGEIGPENPMAGRNLYGCGNGLRKNPLMQKLLEERFGCMLMIPESREEAALGAAKFAGLCLLNK